MVNVAPIADLQLSQLDPISLTLREEIADLAKIMVIFDPNHIFVIK